MRRTHTQGDTRAQKRTQNGYRATAREVADSKFYKHAMFNRLKRVVD